MAITAEMILYLLKAMRHGKSAAALAAIALILCGCSAVVKPPEGRGQAADQRTAGPNRLHCLIAAHLPAREVGQAGIQIGPLPHGPTVQFLPTQGAAQERQISGSAEGAEVIGTALLYPHQASDAELSQIENCLGQGISG
jgi:hypothetical protein